jgi:4,5-dihydroxyphthalate decarboxylase
MEWYVGGKEGPRHQDSTSLCVPEKLPFHQVPLDKALSDMLVEGEIDVLMTPVDPPWVWKNHPNVDRLWPNFKEVEIDYYKRIKIFPIMHTVAIKKEICEANSWVAENMFKAFCEAKRLYGYINYSSGGSSMLPWSIYEYETTVALMGEDFWLYGVDANRVALETFIQYSYEQGVSSRKLSIDELFTANTLELADG